MGPEPDGGKAAWKMREGEIRRIVEDAGGTYCGIQRFRPELEPLVLFNDARTGSTLSLPVSQVSVERVRALLRSGDATGPREVSGGGGETDRRGGSAAECRSGVDRA